MWQKLLREEWKRSLAEQFKPCKHTWQIPVIEGMPVALWVLVDYRNCLSFLHQEKAFRLLDFLSDTLFEAY